MEYYVSTLNIGDKVTSVIDPHFEGIITSIIFMPGATSDPAYSVSYFQNGEPKTVNMYGFELSLTPKQPLGFTKSAGAPDDNP